MTNRESESEKRERASLDALFMGEEWEAEEVEATPLASDAHPLPPRADEEEEEDEPTQVLPDIKTASIDPMPPSDPNETSAYEADQESVFSFDSAQNETAPTYSQTVSERLKKIEQVKRVQRAQKPSENKEKKMTSSPEITLEPNHTTSLSEKKAKPVSVKKKKEIKEASGWRDVLFGWVLPVISAFVIALFLRHFVGSATTVRGTSMEPTLHDGNVLIVSKIPTYTKHYERGEIVIIDSPDEVELYVKRLIGLPGETIRIEDGKVYVNDQWMKEYYVQEDTVTYAEKEWTLGPDEYFVMGDNRGEGASNDSRLFGPVTSDQIEAVSRVRIWPITEFQLTR